MSVPAGGTDGGTDASLVAPATPDASGGTSGSLLDIVVHQRDRFRQRAAQLEDEQGSTRHHTFGFLLETKKSRGAEIATADIACCCRPFDQAGAFSTLPVPVSMRC